MEDSSVRVAVRIRPAISRELIEGCKICTSVTPGQPQVWMGQSHAYTYDYVFDTDSSQEIVFSTVESLVDGCLEGYNATIVAYGQTGSGKTYTMGTGFDVENMRSTHVLESHGIIPRAVYRLFQKIDEMRISAVEKNECPLEFKVSAQFVELHNEEINDLIPSDPKVYRKGGNNGIKIHEDASGAIYMVGVGTKPVNSSQETMNCLREGALCRTTASTNMNDQSSRSHAIFTLHVQQQRFVQTEDGISGPELETLSAKFHFVDLAGSERLKRTGAVGERAREGISINCGLLALGNVISALGDKAKRFSHVPYRDSKLTRLLQDSLGGNSRTVVIVCISPSDRDFVETLNTLKYANRARNIKNKVTVNQDKSSRIIANLRQEIAVLESELQAFKQGKLVTANGVEMESDAHQENLMLNAELENLRGRVRALQETIERITTMNAKLIAEKASGEWMVNVEGSSGDFTELIGKYTLDIEELRAKLLESEATCEVLKRKQANTSALLSQSLSPRPHIPMSSRPGTTTVEFDPITESMATVLSEAKAEVHNEFRQIKKLRKQMKKKRREEPPEEKDDEDLGNGDADENGEGSGETIESSDEGSDEDSLSDLSEGPTHNDIVEINDQINTKQRLIEQLELSNRRAIEIKDHYEAQILCLSNKIKHTEDERDTVLSTFTSKPTHSTTKVKQVKEEYESKLAILEKEMRRMQGCLKEQNNLLKKTATTEKQLVVLKAEVDNMKRVKVKLQNQLKEENVKWREAEAKRLKEIMQLKKDQRKKDVQIRSLESKDRLKEQILKRKHEEVSALKRQNKSNLSRRAAGKVPPGSKRSSPVKAKKKWAELQTTFEKKVSQRKALEDLETEMLSHIEQRKQLKEEIESLLEQKKKSHFEEEINDLNDQIDSLKASCDYSDEKIGEIQRAICETTSLSPKGVGQGPDIALAMEHFTREDCEYIMQKMYEYTMENFDACKEKATKLSIAEQNVQALTRDVAVMGELLQHIFGKYCANDPNLSPELSVKIQNVRNRGTNGGLPTSLLASYSETHESLVGRDPISTNQNQEKENSSCPVSPISIHRQVGRRQISDNGEKAFQSGKARRLTSTTQELLGSLCVAKDSAPLEKPGASDATFVKPGPVDNNKFFRSNSTRGPGRYDRRGTFVISDGSGLINNIDSLNNITTGPPPHSASAIPLARKPNGVAAKGSRPNTAPGSHQINGQTHISSTLTHAPTENFDFDTTFLVETDSGTVSAPGSPNALRKLCNDNVFQRLTSSTSGANIELSTQVGVIRTIREKNSQKYPFQLTHTAEGHSKAVLDVFATDNLLFTGAKDTTVKIWDLIEGREISTLFGSQTSISCVKYSEEKKLIFSASSCYVRVYDIRSNICIKTLSSAGICYSSELPNEPHPQQLPPKEQLITSIALSPGTNSIYTSYGPTARMWDFRTFTPIGTLPGKHNANIMCMTAQSVNGVNTLVTGSKDHSIKVYDYPYSEPMMNIPIQPKATLDPLHYDGVESLALSGSILYSGSRDSGIKKWDLAKPEILLAYNNAHSNWITGLSLAPSIPSLLVSASRDGSMKLWATDSIRCFAQVEAHKGGVNCLAANSSAIFTGSNEDGTIGFWKLRNLTTLGDSSSVNGTCDAS